MGFWVTVAALAVDMPALKVADERIEGFDFAEPMEGAFVVVATQGKRDRDALHCPAGLDIGAVTPDEIALSILAEIIRERRKAAGSVKSEISRASAG